MKPLILKREQPSPKTLIKKKDNDGSNKQKEGKYLKTGNPKDQKSA